MANRDHNVFTTLGINSKEAGFYSIIVAPFFHFDNFSALNATFVLLIVFAMAVLIDKFRIKICFSLMK